MDGEELKGIRWRPSRSGGGLGDEVEVQLPRDDLVELRTWFAAIEQLDPTPRTTQLREVRLILDVYALFPGTRRVRPSVVVAVRDPALGSWLREDALARVDRGSDPAVKREAENAVRTVAEEMPELTSDDVWERMRLRPDEPRMLGPIMKTAARRGIIELTDRTVLSELPQNHRRPVRVWRSLVHVEQQRIV